ncbi:MAG: insulinase family protein [Actinobacteria bacterium]|nr:insulinase family protein [Actinomycetota bacterium]
MVFNRSILDNGIRVLTEMLPQVRSVTLGFWVGVGSRDEAEELSGASHFLEHMLFKGTEKYSARQISETFDSLGGELNAFSAKEYTCFYARLLDEHVPIGVEILSDMLQNTLFRGNDISSEREVVLEEINLYEDTPDDRIHDLFASELWSNHPLGKAVLGHMDTVSNFTREEVVNFFKQHYVSNNIVVAAAGHIDHNELVSLINKYFVLNGKIAFTRKLFVPEVESHIAVYNKNTEQAHICYGTQGLYAKHEDRFALAILDNILGGGMSSRLFQEIREKKGLVYSIYSYSSLYSETGLFSIYAGTRPSKTEQVVRLIQEEIAKLVEDGVMLEELDRSKNHLKGELVLSLESTSHRMSRLGKFELCEGEFLSLDELVERIDKVTLDDVKRIIRNIFDPNKMVLTVIGPFKTKDLSHLLER